MKRKGIKFPIILTTLLIFLSAGNLSAATAHSIHIEWNYDQYSAPIDSELSAYRLYKNGIKVCQFDYPYDYAGNCKIISEDGLFKFTLTAVFEDGTESPHSAPFPFFLGTHTATLSGVFSLLLK